MTKGRVILDLDPDEAEFLADCVRRVFPKDGAAKELYALAEKARRELEEVELR